MSRFLQRILALLLLCALAINGYAQDLTWKGIVKDAGSAEPLIGVTIKTMTGKTIGTTGADGRFSIKLNQGETLVFAYMGYKDNKILVQDDKNIQILLEKLDNQLLEVEITGALGIKRNARELGVATAQVSTVELNRAAVVNPLNGLQGKVSGLQVNMFDSGVNPQVRVTLRGARNISDDNNEPLIVVDGVPMPTVDYFNPQMVTSVRSATALSLLNPNDIENISILKGANAAAIYGSQGVNGVILVTTKKGNQGSGTITYTNSITFDRVGWLPELQQTYGAGINGVYSGNTYESWGPKYDGSMVKVGPVFPDGTQWELPYAPIKNQKRDFFDTGITEQNGLSFSGGNERTTYFLSTQYVYTAGLVPKDRNKRWNFRANGSHKFSEKFNASYSVNYVRANTNTTTSEPWHNVRDLPWFIDLKQLKDWQNDYKAMPAYYFSNTNFNPYWGIDNQRADRHQSNFNGILSFDYQFTPWLKAIYRAGLNAAQTDLRAFNEKAIYPAVYDENGKQLARPTTDLAGSSPSGFVNDAYRRSDQVNSDLILQFSKSFGDYSLNGILGHNYQDIQTKNFNLASSAINVPGTYNQSNRTGNLSGTSYLSSWRRLGFYAEATVGFRQFLFATFNGRQETISLLDPDNRSYFYPGGNLSFIASDAIAALRGSRTVSFLKLYASASKTANVTIDPYQLNNTYSVANGFPFGNLFGTDINTTNSNNNIKPEFVYSWETGFNLGLFDDRVHFEAVYAHADSRDQILSASSSFATGFASTLLNAARMKSKSIELTLGGDVVRNRHFTWSLSANYTHNDNTGEALSGNLPYLNQWKGLYLIPGSQYPTYLVPDYVRDNQGRVVVDATTGRPRQAAELKNVGTSQPVHLLGLATQLRYKNITLSAVVDARWGSKFYTAAAEFEEQNGTAPRTIEYGREDFIFPNSVIEVSPGMYEENTTVYVQGGGTRDYWNGLDKSIFSNNIFDARFIKLREVSLRYDLPASFFQGSKVFHAASFALIGRNLVNLRAKDNIYGETEFIYLNGVGFSGFRTLPATRTYGFNLNVTF